MAPASEPLTEGTRAGRAHRDRLDLPAAGLRHRRLRGGRPRGPARPRRGRPRREGGHRQRAVAASAPRARGDDRTGRARRLRPRGPDPRQARRRRRPAAARVRHLRRARRGVHRVARRGAVTAARRDAAHRPLRADTASGECACGRLPPGRARDRDDGHGARPARRGRDLPVEKVRVVPHGAPPVLARRAGELAIKRALGEPTGPADDGSARRSLPALDLRPDLGRARGSRRRSRRCPRSSNGIPTCCT